MYDGTSDGSAFVVAAFVVAAFSGLGVCSDARRCRDPFAMVRECFVTTPPVEKAAIGVISKLDDRASRIIVFPPRRRHPREVALCCIVIY
jgi:hypothetical protein